MTLVVSPQVAGKSPNYYADFLRANLFANLYWRQFGTLLTIPRGFNTSIKIPRWQTPLETSSGYVSRVNSLTAIGLLTEGTTPSESTPLCSSILSGQTTAFGGVRKYTDRLVLTSYIDWTEAAIDSLARELAYKIDLFTRVHNCATYLAFPAGVTKVGSTGGYLNGKYLASMGPKLDARAVPRWDDGTFVMLTHPFAQYDIYSDISATGWVSVKRYHDPSEIYKGEIGQMYGIRLVVSSAQPKIVGSATASANTCPSAWAGLCASTTGFNAYVFGSDPFYTLEYEGAGLQIIHQPLGSAGAGVDSLNQFGTIGVKAEYGVIKQPAADFRLVRAPHKSTILS